MLLLEGNDLNEMSETLQKKFLSIIDNQVKQNILKTLGETNKQFQDYLKYSNEDSLFLRKTTTDEVARVLKNFDTKKVRDLYHQNLSRYLLM